MAGRRRSVVAAALALVLAPGLAGCYAEKAEPPHQAVIEPSYVFAVGAHQADVMAMLGDPAIGPRFDRVSQTVEVVYSYPFRAIQAESHFPNGTTRAEMVDTIHMFFDRKGVMVKMGSWVDPWYPSVIQVPVQRITVLPRVVHHPWGVITPPRSP